MYSLRPKREGSPTRRHSGHREEKTLKWAALDQNNKKNQRLPGSKKRVKRDSVVVTKARMEKNKGKPKEKAPANMIVEVVE